MKTKQVLSQFEMSGRNALLTAAATHLKAQFVGIDEQIDLLIEHIRPWYLLPGHQERPRIVNLWGMTGVGKTALVKELIDLLGLNSRYFVFDLGNSWRGNSLVETLEHAHEEDNSPAIFMLDEFQKARTIDKDKEDLNNQNRFLWNLLDHGQISYVRHEHEIRSFKDLLLQMEFCLAAGVEVKNGLVISNHQLYRSVFEIKENGKRVHEENQPFIEENMFSSIWYVMRKDYPTRIQCREMLMKLNGHETYALIEEVLRRYMAPILIDCSQDLIIIAGNLDSAYQMTEFMDPDIDADLVRKANASVNLMKIKTALLERFKPEQVARLGNNHIIYPPMSRATFEELICRGLQRLQMVFEEKSGIPIVFKKGVNKVIYREGVFPSQGTRPVFSSIENLAGSRLGNWLLGRIEAGDSCVKVVVDFKGGCLIARFLDDQSQTIIEQRHKLHLPINKSRKSKKNDTQALVAVHEAGHAVLLCALTGKTPLKLVSQTVDSAYGGYMLEELDNEPMNKHVLLNKIAVLLGGIEAERLIFGDAHISLGSSGDLKTATKLLYSAYRKSGLLGEYGWYGKSAFEDAYLTHNQERFDQAILQTLEEARQLAAKTLEKERKFLVALAIELADHTQLESKQVKRLRYAYMPEELPSPYFTYRERLMRESEEAEKYINTALVV